MKVKATNEERKKALARIEELNEFEREIGAPNIEHEKFVTDAKLSINKVERSLQKRGL